MLTKNISIKVTNFYYTGEITFKPILNTSKRMPLVFKIPVIFNTSALNRGHAELKENQACEIVLPRSFVEWKKGRVQIRSQY